MGRSYPFPYTIRTAEIEGILFQEVVFSTGEVQLLHWEITFKFLSLQDRIALVFP